MAYNYYQRNGIGWGTQQFQPREPPSLSYQPQPNWSGADFYNAHARNGDLDLYRSAMNGLGDGTGGVSRHEAKAWHRRAYGGLGEITRMLPAEVGAAAAYEAWRQFKYNTYQTIGGDFERQREALSGMAIAETYRLWQDTGRPTDRYGMQVASQAAAATANMILRQRAMDGGLGNGLGYAGTAGSLGTSGGALSDYGGGGGGGYVRSRRNSFNDMGGYNSGLPPSPIVGTRSYGGSPMLGSSPIPISGRSSPYPGMMQGSTLGTSQSLGVPFPSSPYGGSGGSYGTYLSPTNAVGGFSAGSMVSGAPPGSTIVIQPSHHHRHRSHSHSHHRRHHSTSGYRY